MISSTFLECVASILISPTLCSPSITSWSSAVNNTASSPSLVSASSAVQRVPNSEATSISPAVGSISLISLGLTDSSSWAITPNCILLPAPYSAISSLRSKFLTLIALISSHCEFASVILSLILWSDNWP